MTDRPEDLTEHDAGAGSPTTDDPDQVSFLGGADEAPAPAPAGDGYRVLARKYRPQTFGELVGQEALVRTLTNAFATGRIAHAFILTGVRGVGKTTTARIVAKCLNAANGPTVDFDPADEQCVAIAEDRHVDVIEIDAASHTGVDNIREILDSVRYRPVVGRYKVYIVDEVHMLSRSAFNALLKTLEEPPEHVKFIFATTEVRKVPVTVLSRCQRFDLRRLEPEALRAHLSDVAQQEGIALDDGALRLIARAADGSARDGLSLLDQAIALASGGAVEEAQVRAMLGLADAGQAFDLFDALMRGEPRAALDLLRAMYDYGADPVVVLQDLLELTHWLTRLKFVPDATDGPAASAAEAARGQEMAEKLGVPALTRAWQMLLKGLTEVQGAPSPIHAAEMVLIRLCHAAELPPPADLVRQLRDGTTAPAPQPAVPPPAPDLGPPAAQAMDGGAPVTSHVAPQPVPAQEPQALAGAAEPQSFRALVALFEERRELGLANHLRHNVHLVAFEPGRLELRLTAPAPRDLPNQVLERLRAWCGAHWQVLVSSDPEVGEAALAQQECAEEAAHHAALREHPLIREIMDTFPGTTIEAVRPLTPTEPADDEEDLA